jgi:hypothetical protein
LSIKTTLYGWILLGMSVLPGGLVQAAEYGSYAEQSGWPGNFAENPGRWRPLDQDEITHQTRDRAQSYPDVPIRPPQYQDYTDTPYGLPRGVYRPVEERHNITPHLQGYRFRPLTPNEQVRVRKRNMDHQNEASRSAGVARPTYSPLLPSERGFTGQESLRFRPDKRLPSISDNPLLNNTSDPEFTELYPPTQFRPLHN